MAVRKMKDPQAPASGTEAAYVNCPSRCTDESDFLSGLIDSVSDIMFCKDINGRYLSCNRAFADHVGRSKDKIIGRTDFDIYPREEAEFYRRNDQKMLMRNESRCNEEWISYPDGRSVLTETCKSLYRGADGTLLGIIGIGRDITERKKNDDRNQQMAAELQQMVAEHTHELLETNQLLQLEINERKKTEEALRESEAKYRHLVDNSYDLIWTLNAEGVFTYASPSLLHVLGYESSDVMDRPCRDFLHPDDVARIEDASHRVVHPPDPIQRTEYQVRHANGTWRWQAASITPIFDSDGALSSVVGVSRDITERKQVKQELLWKTAFLEAQVEATLDGILVIDSNGQRILVNQHLLDLWRVPQNIRDDKDDSALLHYIVSSVKDPEKFIKKVTYLYDHPDETSRDEIEFKDGTILDRYSSPVRGKGGEYYGRIWTFRDITERKQAEKAVKESQQKLSDIIDFLPDATFVIDKEGKVIAWNKAIEEMTGKKAADILGKSHYEYAVPFYGEKRPILIDLVLNPREEFESQYIRAERGGLSLEGVAHGPALNGKEVYLYGKASILRDSKGDIEGAIESIRDITARYRAEEKYKSIFENAVMGIFQSTPAGCIIEANDAFAYMLGYASAKEIVKIVTDMAGQLYVNPEQRSEILRLIDQYGTIRDREIPFYRKDGKIVWLAVNGRAIKDRSGNVIYYEGYTQNITEHKALESQLSQTHKMEAIGTLAGGIAHDFNNILSAVIGYAEMTLTAPDITARSRRYLEQIYKAGIQAGELIKQILTFSRQSEEKVYPLKISPIIKEVVKLLRASIPSTIAIQQEIQSEPDTILANPTYIHQILMNLCANAAHAMSLTKGTLKIVLSPVEIRPDHVLIHDGLTAGRHVKLTISDTGHGIAPEIMNKIFDPFFTTKKPGEGTGMGLSVVHGIVKKCSGAITVRSEVGRGTEFNIYFSLLEETEMEQQKAVTEHAVGGGEHILYVDDDDVLVELGNGMLTFLGYKVTGTTSSSEALELFRNCPDQYDMVISDMTMPNMTGLELAQELKRIRPDIPIILCTGFSEQITPERVKSIGLREIIMKPVVLDQMAAAIRRELDRKE